MAYKDSTVSAVTSIMETTTDTYQQITDNITALIMQAYINDIKDANNAREIRRRFEVLKQAELKTVALKRRLHRSSGDASV